MDFLKIDEGFLQELHAKAHQNVRKRINFDLRTTPADTSQRMLNAMETGTDVPIHRHEDTAETTICISGKLDVVFYNQFPNGQFKEINRVLLDPSGGSYGVQIPKGTWHTVFVHKPSMIFEAKDGRYQSK